MFLSLGVVSFLTFSLASCLVFGFSVLVSLSSNVLFFNSLFLVLYLWFFVSVIGLALLNQWHRNKVQSNTSSQENTQKLTKTKQNLKNIYISKKNYKNVSKSIPLALQQPHLPLPNGTGCQQDYQHNQRDPPQPDV